MSRRLAANVRELAAAKIGRVLAGRALTTDEAARILAEADAREWCGLDYDDKEYYRVCAANLLERISDPPLGLSIIHDQLWELI